jgi:hypothetical protein
MGFIRFKGLQKRGIVHNRPQLKRLVDKYGFPAGRLLGPNTRVWDEDTEVDPWLANRPTASKPLGGAAKNPKGRPRKAVRACTAAE